MAGPAGIKVDTLYQQVPGAPSMRNPARGVLRVAIGTLFDDFTVTVARKTLDIL